MKFNYLGIVGGILAFVSVVLPWWAMSISSSVYGVAFSGLLSVNLYQATATYGPVSATTSLNLWFGWTALVFVLLGGLLGLVGSVISRGRRLLLALGGIIVLLSLVVFAVGLQNQISSGSVATGYPTGGAGLFSSGSYEYLGFSFSYSAYLSFGFWLALAAAIIMFVALTRKSLERATPPQPVAPPAQPSPAPAT